MECYKKNYPRPQFVRESWESLDGIWAFAFDDADCGEREKWYNAFPEGRQIRVPFTYEARLSGIGDESHHSVVWYRRSLQVEGEQLAAKRCILHFEGSDYETKLWVNGQYAGSHRGGYARFSFDITDLVNAGENTLTVRVEDHCDLQQTRGKQRWTKENISVFYVQNTGIWKTVWLEYVPAIRLEQVKMTPDIQTGSLRLTAEVIAPEARLNGELLLETVVTFRGSPVNRTLTALTEHRRQLVLDLHAAISNTEEFGVRLWSPEDPALYDITFRILDGDRMVDEVGSYFAMREIRIEGDRILLNEKPLYQRLVLDQGYWKDSLLTPPDEEALVKDIDSVLALGYNGVRKHQKVEDERFLYWCDVKGLLVWGEMAAAFLFTDQALTDFSREWAEVVRQNYNHPCIITWTPFNESWGVLQIRRDPAQQSFTQAVYHLTKSIDPTRPVITNDGWEHTVSDIITLHDYTQDAQSLKQRLGEHCAEVLSDRASLYAARPAFAQGFAYRGQPVIVSEYGGLAIIQDDPAYGFGCKVAAEEFADRFEALTTALKALPGLCGYCYTQLTDVQQEINGLMDMERNFKADPAFVRAVNTR